ncbi:phospholipase/carboxylesterase [Microbacterium sp. cf046]|uniref:alpha/beta hydrolase n=1 Tax=Microbacterium sp. cf046 TaxID=1761803 RepID=UPI0008F38CFC|nr:alpha/beta hydrolase-fold protein [Microbacterium sp. cf046]SFR93975.1 phospholipase/carboxylesterase [Microbacterium sp. cf046]
MAENPALDHAAVLWSAEAADRGDRPLLVLLHGYGADERDLFGLVPYLPSEFVVAAVRAPLAPPFPAPGFSWYPIGRASASRGSGAEPQSGGLDGSDASHVTRAASQLIDWLDVVAAGAVVGLLGFSQGAAVALQAMRLQPRRFSFAVNLSGYATPGTVAGDAELADRRPPVFWGRGTRDDVIPTFLVEHTVTWLPEHAELSGRVYQGLTHSVSEQELADVRIFLEKQLERLAPEN